VNSNLKRGYTDILVASGCTFIVALAGTLLTKIGPWYFSLAKPDWQPPPPAFGIIWTSIYILCVFSAVLAWRASNQAEWRKRLLILFGINAALNVLWCALFFALKRPDFALVEVVPFWLSVGALIVYIWPRHKLAALLLVPYLVWVAIATALNLSIVQLNAPF
jgi:translocator protein